MLNANRQWWSRAIVNETAKGPNVTRASIESVRSDKFQWQGSADVLVFTSGRHLTERKDACRLIWAQWNQRRPKIT